MLDAAADPAAARAAELPVDAADDAERHTQAVTAAGGGEHDRRRRPVCSSDHSTGGGARRVHGEHGEIAVGVDAEHLGLGRAPVGEGDLRRAVTQVVGVGQDLPVGDDHPGAPAITPDGDGRRPDAVGDRGHRRLQFIEYRHARSSH